MKCFFKQQAYPNDFLKDHIEDCSNDAEISALPLQKYTVKYTVLYLINKIVATDYKQYY